MKEKIEKILEDYLVFLKEEDQESFIPEEKIDDILKDIMSEVHRNKQKNYSEVLKSAKSIYKFRDNADTVGNEANSIIKILEG